MIIIEQIKVKVVKSTIGHYRKIVPNIKINDIIEINPRQLSISSNQKVKVKCDDCKKIYKTKYIYTLKKNKHYPKIICRNCDNKRMKPKIYKLEDSYRKELKNGTI